MAEEKNKEDLILDVAKRVIEEKGFYNTRMDDIAELAGVAKGTLYLYFKSKDDLFTKLMEREYNKVVSGLVQVASSKDDVISKLDAVIEGFLKYMEENREFFLSIMYEAPSIKKDNLRKKIRENNRTIQENLGKLVEEGVREGVIRDDVEVPVIVGSIIGTVSRVVFYAINFDREKSLLSFKDSIMKVIFSGILKEKGGLLW